MGNQGISTNWCQLLPCGIQPAHPTYRDERYLKLEHFW